MQEKCGKTILVLKNVAQLWCVDILKRTKKNKKCGKSIAHALQRYFCDKITTLKAILYQ